LRALAEQPALELGTADDACAAAVRLLAGHRADVPFALAYLVDAGGTTGRLAAWHGAEPGSPLAPRLVGPDHPELWAALGNGREVAWTGLADRFPGSQVPLAGGAGAADRAIVVPMTGGADRPVGALVLGVSPYLQLSEEYRAFHRLVAGQLSNAL